MKVLYSDLSSEKKARSLTKKLFLNSCKNAGGGGFYRDAKSFARPSMINEDLTRTTADLVLVESHIFMHRDEIYLFPADVRTNLKVTLKNAIEQLTSNERRSGLFVLHSKSDEIPQAVDFINESGLFDCAPILLVSEQGGENFRRFGLPLHTLLVLKLIELVPDNFEILSALAHTLSGLASFYPECYFAVVPPSLHDRPSIIELGWIKSVPAEFTREIEGEVLGDIQDDIQEIAHYVQLEEDPETQVEAILALLGANYPRKFLEKLNVKKLVEGAMDLEVPEYHNANYPIELEDFQIGAIAIPEGPTKVGISSSEYPAEGPEHTVKLRAFRIGVLPITRYQFQLFLDNSGHHFDTSRWQEVEFSDEEVPANFVALGDAISFCHWATNILRQNGRLASGQVVTLPSEVQWERAARGLRQGQYPWGSEFDSTKCNCKAIGLNRITSSLAFPDGQSDEGVFDLVGNVHEWTRSLWGFGNRKPDFAYPYDEMDGREKAVSNGRMRYVVRGGAYYYEANCLNSYARNYKFPNLGQVGSGFRICIQER